jgi:hypothetical protein
MKKRNETAEELVVPLCLRSTQCYLCAVTPLLLLQDLSNEGISSLLEGIFRNNKKQNLETIHYLRLPRNKNNPKHGRQHCCVPSKYHNMDPTLKKPCGRCKMLARNERGPRRLPMFEEHCMAT